MDVCPGLNATVWVASVYALPATAVPSVVLNVTVALPVPPVRVTVTRAWPDDSSAL
jgi:hypothetical protein